jgi:anti-sigma factor RsiW
MNCARLRQVLDAHLDGEIDRATGTEIEQHLQACPACAGLQGEREAVRQRVREHAPYFRPPAALRRSVRSALAAGDDAARATRRPSWLQAGVLAAVVAIASATAGYWAGRPPTDGSLREQVVASHVASLGTASRLTEVESTDRHVIKPWFQGKVDLAPVVRDLSSEGYTLLGARLDHVADRQATAIVYRVRNHVVNLFAWRAVTPGDEPLALSPARGFNIATWSESGLRFAAVSDVDARELERFARLVQGTPP